MRNYVQTACLLTNGRNLSNDFISMPSSTFLLTHSKRQDLLATTCNMRRTRSSGYGVARSHSATRNYIRNFHFIPIQK